ncbi:protein vip1-like protein [Cinnamomum micranthum f. kanehirae]|uniref:Protein vip1-like protein n=1 Tax=Cinnamomum micranthum f. kanehirae TaxID=337451 RepID=A0A443P819_9MAGN|nr:protein vip1-like protein [Cinnamomum micranthum f. kanehirae]
MALVELTICVHDLSPKVTKADLTTFFSYCGTIDAIELKGNGVESQSARVTFKQPYAQQIALLLNNATILDRQVRILPEKDDTAKTQEQTESLASEQSVVRALQSRGYQMLRRANEAVGNAGSACVTTATLWLSGVFDKASRSTAAQLAVNTNNINGGREAERETTNPRKGK